MKKFLFLLLVLGMIFGGLYMGLRGRGQPRGGAETQPAFPTLPAPAREFRFAVLGRPSELALHALARMPEVQNLPIRFLPCDSAAERWLMLASGQADVAIASTDELALALPRYGLDVRVFPLARHRGSEQIVFAKEGASTPPLVGFLPGGVSQSLAWDLKDPQLKLLEVATPEQALTWLKNGQLRGAALWNPWLDQAKQQGFGSRGDASASTEVWVWSVAGSSTGRVTEEDGLKMVRAWFDLMRQLSEQPQLTQRAIAEENDIAPAQVPATLRGLEFYSAPSLLDDRVKLTEQLRAEMRDKVNLWSLAGETIAGDMARLQVDLEWLDGAGLDGSPVAAPSVTPTSTPGADLPEGTPTPEGDPFNTQPPDAAPLSQAGGGSARSGRLPGPPLLQQPQPGWEAQLGAEPTTAAVATPAGDRLLVGCADGSLACVSASDGSLAWKFSLGERIRSAPAVRGEWVVVAGDNGQIASLDVATGTRRWVYQASSDIAGALAADDTGVYAATMDGQVVCLDYAGTERWTHAGTGNVTVGVALDPRGLVVCGIDSKVTNYDPASGKVLWETRVGGACRAMPTIESGLVLFGCADQNVYALRLKDGSQVWKTQLPDEVAAAGVALGKNYYVGCKDTRVYALDRGTGKQGWNYATRERIVSDLVGAGDALYASSQDQRLYALRASSGQLLWRYKVDHWVQTPWVQGSRVFLPIAGTSLRQLK